MGHYLESSSDMSLHRSLKGNVAQIVSHKKIQKSPKMSPKMSTRMSHRLSPNLLRVLGDLLFNIEMNGCRPGDLKVVRVWLCLTPYMDQFEVISAAATKVSKLLFVAT